METKILPWKSNEKSEKLQQAIQTAISKEIYSSGRNKILAVVYLICEQEGTNITGYKLFEGEIEREKLITLIYKYKSEFANCKLEAVAKNNKYVLFIRETWQKNY